MELTIDKPVEKFGSVAFLSREVGPNLDKAGRNRTDAEAGVLLQSVLLLGAPGRRGARQPQCSQVTRSLVLDETSISRQEVVDEHLRIVIVVLLRNRRARLPRFRSSSATILLVL